MQRIVDVHLDREIEAVSSVSRIGHKVCRPVFHKTVNQHVGNSAKDFTIVQHLNAILGWTECITQGRKSLPQKPQSALRAAKRVIRGTCVRHVFNFLHSSCLVVNVHVVSKTRFSLQVFAVIHQRLAGQVECLGDVYELSV